MDSTRLARCSGSPDIEFWSAAFPGSIGHFFGQLNSPLWVATVLSFIIEHKSIFCFSLEWFWGSYEIKYLFIKCYASELMVSILCTWFDVILKSFIKWLISPCLNSVYQSRAIGLGISSNLWHISLNSLNFTELGQFLEQIKQMWPLFLWNLPSHGGTNHPSIPPKLSRWFWNVTSTLGIQCFVTENYLLRWGWVYLM